MIHLFDQWERQRQADAEKLARSRREVAGRKAVKDRSELATAVSQMTNGENPVKKRGRGRPRKGGAENG